MAGTFGYEAEHAELSRIIAGQRLPLQLDKISGKTRVVANGCSCRHQIADLSGRQPVHVMEQVREFLQITL